MHTRSDINRKQIVVITLDYNKITARLNKGAPSTQVLSTNIYRDKAVRIRKPTRIMGDRGGFGYARNVYQTPPYFVIINFGQCRLRLACNSFITKRVDFYPVPAPWPNKQGNQDGVQTQNRNQRKLHNTGSKNIYMMNDPDRRTWSSGQSCPPESYNYSEHAQSSST